MALNRSLYRTAIDWLAATAEAPFVPSLPVRPPESPVFLIGCGRSGTTILGECFARHRRITYLHEPRRLWVAAYPESDIWTDRAEQRGGRLVLTNKDETPHQSQRLRRLFGFRVWKSGRPVLVEKLPINMFRWSLLLAVFPDARFIHIARDGREVARSIRRRADRPRNNWYGKNDYKWKQLVALARARGVCSGQDLAAFDNYQRGLLEWRLSGDEFTKFNETVPPDRLHQITYNALMESPRETLSEAFRYLGVGDDPRVAAFVNNCVARRTPRADGADLTEAEIAIAGEALQQPALLR